MTRGNLDGELRAKLVEYLAGCAEDEAAIERLLAGDENARLELEHARAELDLIQQAAGGEPFVFTPQPVGPQREPRSWVRRLGAAALLLLPILAASNWGIAAYRLRAAETSGLDVTVTAPTAVIAGLPVHVQVTARNSRINGVDARVEWVGRDQAGAELLRGTRAFRSVVDLEFDGTLELASIDLVVERGDLVRERSLDLLTAQPRPLVYLSQDKPVYRAGETAGLRALCLDRLSFEPTDAWVALEIHDPSGAVVEQQRVPLERGVAEWLWDIPSGQNGGNYALVARAGSGGSEAARLDFQVRRYVTPRLTKRVVLDRETYSPGQRVVAELFAERVEGGLAVGAKVRATCLVDGESVEVRELVLDERAEGIVSFTLPDDVDGGRGSLAVRFESKGTVETQVQPFVIPTSRIQATFFPEGGDLVAGIECRVYAEFTDSLGRPTSARGRILDDAERTVARVDTEHLGWARFQFTPENERSYRFESDTRMGEATQLPAVAYHGVALRSRSNSTLPGRPVALELHVNEPGPHVVALFCRNVLVAHRVVEQAGRHIVELQPTGGLSGVLRATVFNAALEPVAERLVHRESARRIQVEIEVASDILSPGAAQTVHVRTRDEHGKLVPAVCGVSVADHAVRVLRGEPRVGLMEHALLWSDVEALESYAGFEIDDSDRALHVDLLLGTRGWRRFAWRTPEILEAEFGERGQRLLARTGASERLQFVREVGASPAFWSLEQSVAKGAFWTLSAVGLVLICLLVVWVRRRASNPLVRVLAPALMALVVPLLYVVGNLTFRLSDGAVMIEAGLPFDVDEWEVEEEIASEVSGTIALDSAEHAPQVVSRVYAPHPAPVSTRTDFTDVLCWEPRLLTDARGEASFQFDTSDLITTWDIDVDAHGTGRVGQGHASFLSVQPFTLEAKLPVELAAGDRVELPVAVHVRDSSVASATFAATLSGSAHTTGNVPEAVALQNGAARVFVPFEVTDESDSITLEMSGAAGGWTDRVRREIRVVPRGFPIATSTSGRAEERTRFQVNVPNGGGMHSLTAQLTLHPSPLSDLLSGVEGILSEPHGCFEQASSSHYPNILAVNYLDASGADEPILRRNALALIESGYERLLSFECASRGYEWFGADPGHEALSAYGLFEFSDQNAILPVDSRMLTRTREWLLAARDGQGGFRRPNQALHSWDTTAGVSDAYVLTALLDSGENPSGYKQEIELLRERLNSTNDTYLLALGAHGLFLAGERAAADSVRERLKQLQADDGSLRGAETSITSSRGANLAVETAALAILAWLDDDGDAIAVDRAVRFLLTQRRGGTFGATQATVQALRALVGYALDRRRETKAGAVHVSVGGRAVQSLEFEAHRHDALQFDLTQELVSGANAIEIRLTGDNQFPFEFEVSYFAELPATTADAPLDLGLRLSASNVEEGDSVTLRVDVANRRDEPLMMPLVIVGLPAGLSAPTQVLDELTRAGDIAHWETNGRDLNLYIEGLEAGAAMTLGIDLVAVLPGHTSGPASRAYPFYENDQATWVEPLEVYVSALR